MEKQLNVDFLNIFDWFVDDRLSTYFGEDETKMFILKIFFDTKNLNPFFVMH